MNSICSKFDPLAWVHKDEASKCQPEREEKYTYEPLADVYGNYDELSIAQAVCDELIRTGANIAESYADYLRLGFSLAQGLGADGHDIYHALCSQSGKYRKDECEAKWKECLSSKNGKITIATYYWMAREAGVDLNLVFNKIRDNYEVI